MLTRSGLGHPTNLTVGSPGSIGGDKFPLVHRAPTDLMGLGLAISGPWTLVTDLTPSWEGITRRIDVGGVASLDATFPSGCMLAL